MHKYAARPKSSVQLASDQRLLHRTSGCGRSLDVSWQARATNTSGPDAHTFARIQSCGPGRRDCRMDERHSW